MSEGPSTQKPKGLNRRRFIGALGATAAAGAFLQRGRSQNPSASQTYYYQDSFGNILPAGEGAISLGIYPPPVPASLAPPGAANPDTCTEGAAGTTYYQCSYPIYNILLIIVDQMRNPAFWLPSGNDWVSTYASILPNITGLAKQSLIFPHYYVAATVCTPSRACLLTGLYSQQTCILKTGGFGETPVPPPLLPYNYNRTSGNNNNAGFPTIGNVLSQGLPVGAGPQTMQYDCTWIGKWHLSCASGNTQYGLPGEYGPSDYGFNSSGGFNIPTANTSSPYPAHLATLAGMNANPQEVLNQYFNNNGGNSSLGQSYHDDFFNIGPPPGMNIQQELYYLQTYGSNSNNIQQVQGAIQTAFNNYISYLACEGWLTGNNGQIVSCSTGCSNDHNPYHGLL